MNFIAPCDVQAQVQNLVFESQSNAWMGASGPVAPPVPTNFTIVVGSSLNGGIVMTWSELGSPDTIDIYRSLNGGAFAAYDTVPGGTLFYTDTVVYAPGDLIEYKIRAVKAGIPSAFTIVRGALNNRNDAASVVVNISYPTVQILIGGFYEIAGSGIIQSVSFPELLVAGQVFDPGGILAAGSTALLSFSAPKLNQATVITFSGSPALTSVNFHNLVSVDGIFDFNSCNSLSAFDVTSLVFVGGNFDLSFVGLANPTFPALTEVDGDFLLVNMPMNTISLPVLASVGGDLYFQSSSLLSLTVPNLTNVNDALDLTSMSMAGGISFPALSAVGELITLDGSTGVTTVSFPVLTSIAIGFLSIQGCDLVSADFSALQTVGTGVLISNNPNIVSLDVSALTQVGGRFIISNNLVLASMPIGALQTTGDDFLIADTALAAIALTSLTAVSTNLNGNDFTVSNNPSLVTLSTPVLNTVDQTILIQNNTVLSALSFPALVGFGEAMSTNNNPALVSVSFGDMSGGFNDQWDFSNNVSLANLTMPNINFPDNGINVGWSGCALTAASVNLVLARCRASGDTSNNIDTSGGTSAAPTGQGIVDKAFLIGAGNSVTTN